MQSNRFFRYALMLSCSPRGRVEEFSWSGHYLQFGLQILLRLLEAWSKGYGAKYMAYEYELSLTKAVLLGLGVLKECVHFEHNYGQSNGNVLLFSRTPVCGNHFFLGILRFAMHGLEKRLLSSDIAIRRNGMIVGETITAIISPAPDTVLKFDVRGADWRICLWLRPRSPCHMDKVSLRNHKLLTKRRTVNASESACALPCRQSSTISVNRQCVKWLSNLYSNNKVIK